MSIKDFRQTNLTPAEQRRLRDIHNERTEDEYAALITECERLCATVDEFAREMRDKLITKACHDWSGWDAKGLGWKLDCQDRMLTHVAKVMRGVPGQEADVANFAMFHWLIERTPGGDAP